MADAAQILMLRHNLEIPTTHFRPRTSAGSPQQAPSKTESPAAAKSSRTSFPWENGPAPAQSRPRTAPMEVQRPPTQQAERRGKKIVGCPVDNGNPIVDANRPPERPKTSRKMVPNPHIPDDDYHRIKCRPAPMDPNAAGARPPERPPVRKSAAQLMASEEVNPFQRKAGLKTTSDPNPITQNDPKFQPQMPKKIRGEMYHESGNEIEWRPTKKTGERPTEKTVDRVFGKSAPPGQKTQLRMLFVDDLSCHRAEIENADVLRYKFDGGICSESAYQKRQEERLGYERNLQRFHQEQAMLWSEAHHSRGAPTQPNTPNAQK